MNLKSIFMSMLAVAALASCSNNDDEILGGTQEGKDSSWMGVSVSLPASSFGTRAADAYDGNAEDIEAAVETIDIYYEKTDGTVDFVTTFNVNDFKTPVDGKYTATKAVKVPVAAGQNVTLFAVVNKLNELEGPDYKPFRPNWFKHLGTAADPNVNYWEACSFKLSGAFGEFTMTGTGSGMTYGSEDDALDSTTTPPATHANIAVSRLVAKVLVTTSEHSSIDVEHGFADNNVNGASGEFQGNSLKWTIGNNNRKVYALEKKNGGVVKDPNWDALTGGEDLTKEYDNDGTAKLVPAFSNVPANGYVDNGGVKTAYVQYCNENTNETYQYGNTTFISIEAVFVPSKVVTSVSGSVGGGDYKADVTDNILVVDFWYNPVEVKYYTDAAKEAAVTTGGKSASEFKGPYTGGKCYYFVPITGKDGKPGVLRNNYYTMRINSLKAPGEFKPIPEDPEKPVVQSSWISVDFSVAKWNTVSMGDHDLE